MIALWMILHWTRRPTIRECDPVRAARAPRGSIVRRVVERVALHDRRLDQAWTFLAASVAALLLYLGAGYAIGGKSVTTNSGGWRVLNSILPGGLHTHGVILCVLGFGLAVEIHGSRTRVAIWTLRLLRTYCMFVALCWIGSWFTAGISWGAPGWWSFLAAVTVWLSRFAPLRTGA